LGKLGFLGVLVVVGVAHWFALRSVIMTEAVVAKPKAKVHRITLSSVVIKKPAPAPITPPKPVIKPTVEPIILPADPEPVIEPIVEKPKPKHKPKRKKRKAKRKTKKVHKPKPKPVIKEIIPEVVEPIMTEQVAPVQEIDTSSIKDQYTSEIRRQIQRHLYYPRIAKRMRMQGVVRVAFRVLKNGKITNIRVINSPKKVLSIGAIKTLKSLALKAIPDALGEVFLDITVPIEFKLIKG